MKKYRLFALALAMFVLTWALLLPVGAVRAEEAGPDGSEDPMVTQGSRSPDAARPIYESGSYLKSAAAGILYEVTTDTLVYARHPDKQLSPSSLTKIMTALLAVELGDLNDLVTVSWRSLESVPQGAMVAGLYPEELITLKELIYVLMVGSANDAAAVIADHIAGSQEAFVELMNSRAAELGCTGTTFRNVHGLHHEDQVTTARDVVKILRQAIQNPFFAEVFGTPTYVLAATNKAEKRSFSTTNYMGSQDLTSDYYDERVTGGRTGNTDEGHRNLAITAEFDGAVYIAVVLEAKSEYASNGVMLRQGAFEDAGALLDLGFQESQRVQILYSGQTVEQLPVQGGMNDVVIGPAQTVTCVLPMSLDPKLITYRLDLQDQTLRAPVEEGQAVGSYQVFYNGLCVASVPLFTHNSSSSVPIVPVQPEQPRNPGFDAGALPLAFIILGVIFAAMLLFFGGLLLWRRFQGLWGKHKNKVRQAQRRAERKRSK